MTITYSLHTRKEREGKNKEKEEEALSSRQQSWGERVAASDDD